MGRLSKVLLSAAKDAGGFWSRTIYFNKKHYPVTFLNFLNAVGFFAMSGYTTFCVLYNPDISLLPMKDHRRESYTDKPYVGAKTFKHTYIPAVRISHDGTLNFPYEDKAEERMETVPA